MFPLPIKRELVGPVEVSYSNRFHTAVCFHDAHLLYTPTDNSADSRPYSAENPWQYAATVLYLVHPRHLEFSKVEEERKYSDSCKTLVKPVLDTRRSVKNI